jgi:hypothetical protein
MEQLLSVSDATMFDWPESSISLGYGQKRPMSKKQIKARAKAKRAKKARRG